MYRAYRTYKFMATVVCEHYTADDVAIIKNILKSHGFWYNDFYGYWCKGLMRVELSGYPKKPDELDTIMDNKCFYMFVRLLKKAVRRDIIDDDQDLGRIADQYQTYLCKYYNQKELRDCKQTAIVYMLNMYNIYIDYGSDEE